MLFISLIVSSFVIKAFMPYPDKSGAVVRRQTALMYNLVFSKCLYYTTRFATFG